MIYKIFWIDDSRTWVKSMKASVTEAFEDQGFSPIVETFESIEPAKESIFNSYADLILVDCNLPDGRGNELIQELREQRCFAHILFYSQDASNLDSLNEDKHFLHVSNRTDVSEVLEKIADQAYRKYNHPAFMRGLLLSEFIDLENLMEDLVVSCFKSEGDYFRSSIIHKGGESFSLAVKQKFISRLIKDAAENDKPIKDKVERIAFSSNQFSNHIMKKRNILAHAHPTYDSGTGNIQLVSSIENITFDSEWFHETREKIHDFKIKVKDLIELRLHRVVNP